MKNLKGTRLLAENVYSEIVIHMEAAVSLSFCWAACLIA